MVSSSVGIWYTACDNNSEQRNVCCRKSYTYSTEAVSEEERLEEGVHVARCTLILKANVTCFFLRIVATRINSGENTATGRQRNRKYNALVEVVP